MRLPWRAVRPIRDKTERRSADPTEATWGQVLLSSICRAVLTTALALTAVAVMPLVWGWESSVIRSGSMSPAVRTGDVLVTRPVGADQLRPGQVLVVDDPDHPGDLRAHRLTAIRPDGRLELKGDANQTPDSTPVDPAAVRGVGVLSVPRIGTLDVWMSEGSWDRLGGCLLAVLLLDVGRRHGRPRRRTEASARRADGSLVARRSLVKRPSKVPVLAALVLLSAGGPEDRAYAAFTHVTSAPTNHFGTAAIFNPYRDAVLADVPTRYWRLSETVGASALDASGNSRTGTYYGAFTLGQPSALASELAQRSAGFTAGRVTANTAETAPSAFSLEAFVRTTASSGGQVVGFGSKGANQASNINDRLLYLTPAGKVAFGIGGSGSSVRYVATTPLSYNDGSWHHIVGTYSQATGLRVYVDGTLVASTATPSAAPTYNGFWRVAGEDLTGWPNAPTGEYLAGQIDEVAVYTAVLSAARITAHNNAAAQ